MLKKAKKVLAFLLTLVVVSSLVVDGGLLSKVQAASTEETENYELDAYLDEDDLQSMEDESDESDSDYIDEEYTDPAMDADEDMTNEDNTDETNTDPADTDESSDASDTANAEETIELTEQELVLNVGDDGTTISLSGSMPKDAYAEAHTVDLAIDGQLNLAVYNVSIYDANGEKFEPKSAIQVAITNSKVQTAINLDRVMSVYYRDAAEQTPWKLDYEYTDDGTGVKVLTETVGTFAVTKNALLEQTLDVTADDGTAITMSGVMPDGATVTATPAEVSIEGMKILAAYDITIYDSLGNEYQPQDGAISVQIASAAVVEAQAQINADAAAAAEAAAANEAATTAEGETTEATAQPSIHVFHMQDGAVSEEVSSQVTESGVAFQATGFSTYVIAADDIELTAINGTNITLSVGETQTVSAGWYQTLNTNSTDTNVATVSKSDNTVTVTGVGAGTTTFTLESNWNTTTYTVTVGAPAVSGNAAIFWLANPEGDPVSNATGSWMPPNGSSSVVGTVNVPAGENWSSYESTQYKNLIDGKSNQNIGNYITWPDGSTGQTWTVTKDSTYFNTVLSDAMWNAYQTSIQKELGVTVSKDEITEITLCARKISRENGGTYPVHIDCSINVKASSVYTARFNVKEPGSNSYTQVYAKNYKKGDSVALLPDSAGYTIGSTKEYNGVTYVLKGWYAENSEGGAYGNQATFNYTPSDAELSDGAMNFYAEYVPKTTDVTVQKVIGGSMGDKTKTFAFSISYTKIDENGNQTTETATATLGDTQTTKIESVLPGSTITVTETGANGYTTSATVNNATASVADNGDSKSVTATVSADGTTIVVTNSKEVIPDTGVNFDSAPYILLITFAAAGLLLFIVRKRRLD